MFAAMDESPLRAAAQPAAALPFNGIDEFHFYTLNRPKLTYTIAHVLGVRPRTTALPS
jgi:methylenetetrahydrofolate reductase (NADPH)